MTSIPRLDRLASALGKRKAAAPAAPPGPGPRPPPQPGPDRATGGLDGTRRRVAETLRCIDAADPQGRGQAMRAFVEVVLVDAFGERLLMSPRFVEIVADVQAAIEDSPAVEAELSRFLATLRPAKATP